MSYRLIVQAMLFALTLNACAPVANVKDEAPEQEQTTSSVRASDKRSATVSTKISTELATPPLSEKALIAAVNDENSIFFPPAGTTVDARGHARLMEHANRLKASPDLVVTLIGHTDDLGSPSYNLAIAEQRVNAVYAILRSQRVPVTQIRRYGVGNEEMERACKSEACRSKMRRVELVFGE